MIDVKCKNCNKLLAKANTINAAIKCSRCKMIFEYQLFSNLTVLSNSDMLPTESTETDPLRVI